MGKGVRFSSLYIGILAATLEFQSLAEAIPVSVPFTSGSSLQLWPNRNRHMGYKRFSSLYIGILAATRLTTLAAVKAELFQFPLHRDPRCNEGVAIQYG